MHEQDIHTPHYLAIYNDFFTDYVRDNSFFEFMNHGFYPPYRSLEKYFLRNQASLYFNLIEGLDLSNKSLLDIGCGRGGGALVYKNHTNIKNISACDINPLSIEFCKTSYTGIDFKVCNATALQYNDQSFNIITNVESAHCYSNFEKFISEVHRVLAPGGVFCYTDIFGDDTSRGVSRITTLYQSNLFKNIEEKNITKNVMDSCRDNIKTFSQITDIKLRDWCVGNATTKEQYYSTGKTSYMKFTCFT